MACFSILYEDDNKGYESDIEDELIEMQVDFEAKELFKS